MHHIKGLEFGRYFVTIHWSSNLCEPRCLSAPHPESNDVNFSHLASNLLASNQIVMAMASNLLAVAFNLLTMASSLEANYSIVYRPFFLFISIDAKMRSCCTKDVCWHTKVALQCCFRAKHKLAWNGTNGRTPSQNRLSLFV